MLSRPRKESAGESWQQSRLQTLGAVNNSRPTLLSSLSIAPAAAETIVALQCRYIFFISSFRNVRAAQLGSRPNLGINIDCPYGHIARRVPKEDSRRAVAAASREFPI